MSVPGLDDVTLAALQWPHRESSRFVERGRVRWHVQIMGAGPVMLLVHGTGASSHSFRDLLPRLAERFTVVVPDLPGHAFTTVPSGFLPSIDGMAAALDELLEALAMAPVVAVGHSAGAAILARMALDRSLRATHLIGLGAALTPFDGVAGLVLPATAKVLAITSQRLSLRVGNSSRVEGAIRSTGSRLDARGLELYVALASRPSHVAGVLSMMASWDLAALHEELSSLDARWSFIAGRFDRAVPVEQQRAVARRLGNARFIVVDAAGHLVHEEQPDVVARLILEAVDGRTPQ